MFTRRFFAVLLLTSLAGIGLMACTLPAISQLDLIVGTAEAVIPLIPNVPPAYISRTEKYVDGTLKVADDLLGQELTTDTLARAIGDFNGNVVPQIGDAKIQSLLNVVDKAVQTFVTNYGNTVVQTASLAPPSLPAKKTIRVSAKDKARLSKIHDRVKASRAKLKKRA